MYIMLGERTAFSIPMLGTFSTFGSFFHVLPIESQLIRTREFYPSGPYFQCTAHFQKVYIHSKENWQVELFIVWLSTHDNIAKRQLLYLFNCI